MQVDPIKPKLKPPGTKRLKLKNDEPLSNFALKFNLRRYSKANDDEVEEAHVLVERHRQRCVAGACTRSHQSSTLATPGHSHE